MKAKHLFFGVWLALAVPAFAASVDDDEEERPWREIEATLPQAPRQENLLPFYVSATTANRFEVDAASVNIGADGVVRYTLVVTGAGGARNVSFEGVRCASREYRLYAFGRPDGSWGKARGARWQPIGGKTVNRHHTALYHEYFCVDHTPPRDAAAAVDMLRRGAARN